MTTDRWRQISSLFHQALEQPEDRRQAYLREVCEGDETLCREVEELIASGRNPAAVDVPAVEAAARALGGEAGTAFVGRRLGAYQITAFLGAGGMGEVYKAFDTRLDRVVAIKILPTAFAADPQFRERFNREARSISQLDHPHICALHDVGDQDGAAFLVMQYLEGETLEQRLKKGALPIDRAIQYAIQIADALAAAHRTGIVHRDLKPGNIMLTRNGATLLDFGLAKAAIGAGVTPGVSTLLSGPSTITAEGAILGTVQYMAPEQIEGREADARTDIFAFGVMVYEMLTGKRAFAGETNASLISAILRDEPLPISTHQPAAPPSLEHIVRRCLAKDLDERWQTAADVMRELKWVTASTEPSSDSKTAWRLTSLAARKWLLWISATVTAIGTALFVGFPYVRGVPVSDEVPMRFGVAPPRGISLRDGMDGIQALAMSPDGHRMAFVASRGTRTLLCVHTFDALDAQPLAGTEGASYPFWSADGRSLGFFTLGATLKTVDASGGLVRVLSQVPNNGARGGTWGSDGTIIFGSTTGGLFTIPASGGQPSALTRPDAAHGEISHRFPVFLPDGRHFLYSSQPSNTLWLASIDSNETTQILPTDSQAQYLEPGYLLFGRQGTLMAQAFDWRRGILENDAVRLVEQVLREPSGALAFAASAGGPLAYRIAANPPATQLTWFDRSGRRVGAIESTGPYLNPALSPDGNRVAVQVADPLTRTDDIWLLDARSGERSRFTFDQANDIMPVWSPDGHWIMFGSDRSGVYNLYQKRSDGAGSDDLVLNSSARMVPNSFSRDGRTAVYVTTVDGLLQVGLLPLAGVRTPGLFERKAHFFAHAQVSPDGKWMAYQAAESRPPMEVYVESFPRPGGGEWQISKNGAAYMRWRPDGRELVYYAFDGPLMAAPIRSGAALEVGTAVRLFEAPMLGGPFPREGYRAQFDIAPDGRLLLNVPVEDSASSAINVVVNWKSLLKN